MNSAALQGVSGDPLLGLTRAGEKGFKVIETERRPIAPRSGLILERAGEGRCEERTMLAVHSRWIVLARCASLLSSRVLQCDRVLHKTDQPTHILLHLSVGLLHIHI